MAETDSTAAHSAPDFPASPGRFRSGAAARIAGLPVSTLRIWERRYRVVAPPLTESGHRLYSRHDVQRLTLLKQLAVRGHAIGTIATLSLAELQELMQSAAGIKPVEPAGWAARAPAQPVSLVVVGSTIAERLRTEALRRALLKIPVEVTAVYADVAAAEQAGPAPAADTLLVQVGSLQLESANQVLALARRFRAGTVALLYGFGPEAAAATLRAAGVLVRRATLSDYELAALLVPAESPEPAPRNSAAASPAAPAGWVAVPARRISDETLVSVAAMSATIACECPKHVAELVMQLSSFEQYSADCLNRSPADEALHGYLRDVAGSARALFEVALERVAAADGIDLTALARRQ